MHAGFYRLSEDLDFAISAPLVLSRSKRSKMADPLKNAINNLTNELDMFRLVQPLTGANNSMQYIAVVGYQSLLGGYEEIIKIELGLREPLIMPPVKGNLKTILLNPVSGNAMMQPFYFQCISYEEGMAEKFRAALSRREPAIRDFYDIDYAIRKKNFIPDDVTFLDLVSKKVAVPDNAPVNVTDQHYDSLKKQLDTELKPVLRGDDYKGFDLERVFKVVRAVADRLENISSFTI
ncbi:MAG: nucleotidyl transferase AbiEii/AbiGii toxin family protein [Deltaproteobacteria bacterium]|nr:nucleotidyl transferase AbiEii/AbiGii toxin family protein [Deltaproteobacteria bacterium]